MKTSITEGQKKQYRRFVEDAAEKALMAVNIDKDRLQKLIERGHEFQAHIIAGINELSVINQYADEEVKSSYGYFSGYKPRKIAEQIARLHGLFPKLDSADENVAKGDIPLNAEGWFAIPRWKKIAPTYGEAVQKVLDLIKQIIDGNFQNYDENKLGPQYLRQHVKTAKIFQTLGYEQKDYDILVVPAQFGLNHRGKSVRRARGIMNASEFGLGAFAVGIMILTHPERLHGHDDLWINCAGDEYNPISKNLLCAPCFTISSGSKSICFSAHEINCARDCCGSASAFLKSY